MMLKGQVFRLEYLSYGKFVWVMGMYEELPWHLKLKEPLIYPRENDYIPSMIEDIHAYLKAPSTYRKKYLIRQWYKEYFYSYFIMFLETDGDCFLCFFK